MQNTTQPEALRLAAIADDRKATVANVRHEIAAELRRLHARVVEPEAQATTVPAVLHDIDAGMEVMAWLRESRAPHSIYSKMSACLFGDPDKKAAPQPEAQEESDLEDALRGRDAAEDFIDHLLDEVLGHERPEWSSGYGRDNALNDVQERMTALHKPAIDKSWARFEAGMAAPQPEACGWQDNVVEKYKD